MDSRQRGLVLLFLGLSLALPCRACTIFLLVDGQRTYFCNNEDFSNPRTRIWFVPAGKDFLGCAYAGFDDGWAQGGVNTEGLAFDWVAGFEEIWKPGRSLRPVRGNSSQRMLETCRTVDEAIEFYRAHLEKDFFRSKILVADKTGASAIIGAHDGKLQVQRESRCRGFGYAGRVVTKMLNPPPEATVGNGFRILRAARQEGEFATKYSNVFDLRSGEIWFVPDPKVEKPIRLNLADELKKGAHYYDLPLLEQQLAVAPQPLLNNMKRFLIDEFHPIQDSDPKMTDRLSRIMRDAQNGRLHEEDYTPELWKELSGQATQIRADLNKLGQFVSLTRVERRPTESPQLHRFRVTFSSAVVLQTFRLDDRNRISASESETVEFLPAEAPDSESP